MAKKPIEVEALKHDAATRKNIPTAEFESVMREADKTPHRKGPEYEEGGPYPGKQPGDA